MAKRIDMEMICPFYHSVFGKYIYCAPVTDDAEKTANVFKNTETRNAYADNFCGDTKCWKTCVIAQMLMEKYDAENGG